jgi:DNA-binding beta-propeller fold protein YncE
VEIEPTARRLTWRDARGAALWTLEGAPPDPETLNYPVAAAFDASTGLLHVVDRGWGCVHTITSGGQRLGAWGGQHLRSPRGIAQAPDGGWFVADGALRRVWRFSASGRALGQLGGQELCGAGAIALDKQGQLHVVDPGRGCVHRYLSRAGTHLGSYDQGGHPCDIAVDGSGVVWVADAVQGELRGYRASGAALLRAPLEAGRRVALGSAGDSQVAVVELV